MKKKAVVIASSVLALILIALVALLQQGHGEQTETQSASVPEKSQSLAGAEPVSNETGDKLAAYPDAVAWLQFPGTDIDGPVMQAEDNDYYLRRNEAGEDDVWGCYYLDYECTPKSKNLIIYGHSLADSTDDERFSQLKRLNDEAFAAEHNIINVTINGQTRAYKVASSGLASDLTDHNTIVANPEDDTMENILNLAQARSQHDYGVSISKEDSILTLSTCTSDENMRYVVVAKLVK